jgi:hypothetical protein
MMAVARTEGEAFLGWWARSTTKSKKPMPAWREPIPLPARGPHGGGAVAGEGEKDLGGFFLNRWGTKGGRQPPSIHRWLIDLARWFSTVANRLRSKANRQEVDGGGTAQEEEERRTNK